MQLSDIYFNQRATRMNKTVRGHYEQMTKAFYSYKDSKTGKDKQPTSRYLSPHQASVLNKADPPTNNGISIYQRMYWQKELAKQSQQLKEGQLAIENLKKIFNTRKEIQDIDISSFNKIEEDLLNYAEALSYGNQNLIKKYEKENNLKSGAGKKYLIDLRNNVIKLLEEIKKSELPSQINYAFEAFENRLQSIENYIQGIDTDDIQLGAYTLKKDSKEIRWKLYQISKILLGHYLESKSIDFLRKVIPSNIRVIQTGQIKGPSINILGRQYQSGKDIKEDILFFDITSNINITYTIDGKVKTEKLQKFLDTVEKDKNLSIQLDYDNYNLLIDNSLGGIQSKLGSGNNIKFSNVSLEEVLVKSYQGTEFQEQALYNLWYLKSILGANILASHEYYDKFFNFNLARVSSNIVGKNNYIILTDKGFDTMYDYILDRLNQGSYFYTGQPISLLQKEKRLPIKIQIK